MPPSQPAGIGCGICDPWAGGTQRPFRGTLVPGFGEATAAFRLPSPGFPGLDPRL